MLSALSPPHRRADPTPADEGFSLPELLVTTMVLGLVMAAFGGLVGGMFRDIRNGASLASAQRESSEILSIIVGDLRSSEALRGEWDGEPVRDLRGTSLQLGVIRPGSPGVTRVDYQLENCVEARCELVRTETSEAPDTVGTPGWSPGSISNRTVSERIVEGSTVFSGLRQRAGNGPLELVDSCSDGVLDRRSCDLDAVRVSVHLDMGSSDLDEFEAVEDVALRNDEEPGT